MSFSATPAGPSCSLGAECTPDKCMVVIFGATGDLTYRKLIPALFNLVKEGHFPSKYGIVGVARRDWSDEKFRDEMLKAIDEHSRNEAKGEEAEEFVSNLHYFRLSFDDAERYDALEQYLGEMEDKRDLGQNRLYYLATLPGQFMQVVKSLHQSGSIAPMSTGGACRRVVLEKPFGHDYDSAVALNRELSTMMDENQIFRIDHYLGKETVQNLMVFRFANAIFEPIWNRRHIASIQINVPETTGMPRGRGGYYETSGALRDMMQNHLMSLLCLVAMEPPARLDAPAIHNEKVKVLRSIAPLSEDDVKKNVVRGQYGEGTVHGEAAAAYRDEEDVEKDSQTETFVAMRLEIDNWRWAGVPFFLRTGKRMPVRASEIAIQFKVPPIGLFGKHGHAESGEDLIAPNSLLIRIQPNEGIAVTIAAKVPGMDLNVRPVKLDFTYEEAFETISPEAYERLLLDALNGDSTLFNRNDEVEAAWEIVNPIMEYWDQHKADFPNYEAGNWGPEEQEDLFEDCAGQWRKP